MRGGATPERISKQCFEVTRKRIGKYRASLDQPGVTKAGASTRPAAIDQQHIATAFLQFEGEAQTDNASAEYKHIC